MAYSDDQTIETTLVGGRVKVEKRDTKDFLYLEPSYQLVFSKETSNLKTGKIILVRINDRGPFIEGRIIDLSMAAAKKLGVYRAGTGKVVIWTD